ncbi:hypothetical protein PHLCEN_2v8506 [Hermanssonia centrifuga]|uniref:Uncharacterized protein n=1 Tax=Hermanssonia centrifuga TaxID=98765 RepID=A0A2R6NU49_9APHY|nr:hypothetical protein PHLCEN_2v8506 [Hermanssonia centrifuga]
MPRARFKDISGRAQDGTKLKPEIGGFEGGEMQLYIELNRVRVSGMNKSSGFSRAHKSVGSNLTFRL